MEKQEVLTAIKEELESRGHQVDGLSEQTRLQEDLDLDSLDAVEFAGSLEDRFDIEIPDEELEDVETIGDAVQLVQSKAGG
jgi:acyl carrier protein